MNTLKKYLAFLFVIILLVSTSACQQNESSVDNPKDNNEEVYELLIPASYMKYSGVESDELCNSIISKGKTYATDATVVDNGVKILATQKQIDNLIDSIYKGTFLTDGIKVVKDIKSMWTSLTSAARTANVGQFNNYVYVLGM